MRKTPEATQLPGSFVVPLSYAVPRFPGTGGDLYVDRADGVDPVQDGVFQVLRGGFGAGALNHLADNALKVILLSALRAIIKVVLDLRDVRTGQCPVKILIDALHPGVITVAQSLAVAHFLFSCFVLAAVS
jgi:hypothetical protein